MTPALNTTGSVPALPAGTDVAFGAYVLTAYTLYGDPTKPCNTVQPLATTLAVTALVPPMTDMGSITGATVLTDGSSSTFSGTFTTSGSIIGLDVSCPSSNNYMISWGTTTSVGGTTTLDFEFGATSPLTPLNADCTAIVEYTLQP